MRGRKLPLKPEVLQIARMKCCLISCCIFKNKLLFKKKKKKPEVFHTYLSIFVLVLSKRKTAAKLNFLP